MEEDFEEFYREHYQSSFYYVYRFLPQPANVEDVVSEVFLALWKSWQTLVKPEHRKAFLYRVTCNKVNDFLRKYYAFSLKTEVFDEAVMFLPSLEENSAKKGETLTKLIWEKIATLSERDRELLRLRYVENKTFVQIAEALGITENNAKVKHHRLIIKLQELCKQTK